MADMEAFFKPESQVGRDALAALQARVAELDHDVYRLRAELIYAVYWLESDPESRSDETKWLAQIRQVLAETMPLVMKGDEAK